MAQRKFYTQLLYTNHAELYFELEMDFRKRHKGNEIAEKILNSKPKNGVHYQTKELIVREVFP